jgi:hypothetical protein
VSIVVPPPPTLVLLAEFKKMNNKDKRTMCDVVRDNTIPHLTGKYYAFEMWVYI